MGPFLPWGVTPQVLQVGGTGGTCGWGIPAMGWGKQQGDPGRARRSKQSIWESCAIHFLGRRMETLPLIVLSWDFHAYPNLMCLDVLAAGHSWRQKQQLGVHSVSLGGEMPLGQSHCKTKHATSTRHMSSGLAVGSVGHCPASSAGACMVHISFLCRGFREGGARSLSHALFFHSCEITRACSQ